MKSKRLSAALMMAAIASISRSDHSHTSKMKAIQEIGPYQSRGKGGKTPRTFSGVAKARRAAKRARLAR